MGTLTPTAFVVVDTENSCQDFVHDTISSSDKVLVLLVSPPKPADPAVPDPFKRPKEVSDSSSKRDWVWIVRAASTEKQAVDVMVSFLVSFLVRSTAHKTSSYCSLNLSDLGKSEGIVFERCYPAADTSRTSSMSHMYGGAPTATTLSIRLDALPALIIAAGGADSRYPAVVAQARMQCRAVSSYFKPENIVLDNSLKLLDVPSHSRPIDSVFSAKKLEVVSLQSYYFSRPSGYVSLQLHSGITVPCCHLCNMLFDSESSASSHLSMHHFCFECKSWSRTVVEHDAKMKPCDVDGHCGASLFCAATLDAHKTECRIQVERRRAAAAATAAQAAKEEEDRKRQIEREIASRTCTACPKPREFKTISARDQHTRSKHHSVVAQY